MNPAQAIFVANNTVQMTDVLDLHAYPYERIPGQIPCPVHKSGQEIRRSARIYEDNSIYCFTCGKQYGPVDIHATLAMMSKEAAAEDLLQRFPPDPEKSQALQKEYHAPRVKPVNTALLENTEELLRSYRHRVPLESYREWVLKLDALAEILKGLPLEEQKAKVTAFKLQLRKSLDPLKTAVTTPVTGYKA